ncbi:AAA family ATPase [Luteimonas sp. MC1825]|uniref:ATP-dependent nuclease n=1 Tax=Luteimonas sp. MC1825 TaxID=2761107 RepID=UPI00161073A8|nr:AAA family ATPase [Luteimonas sp. MC1825]MBB6600318.1 AAA family ATPase [Luteimonas sp. MC1825]QOC87995.1 AAA family ATPase [Luteimonas sp. MC1825]
MKIRRLKIRNFRGVNQLEWNLPDENIFCLIGKGDSTKTTVLEAVRCAFSPQWNHSFNDSDFNQCKTDSPIEIEVVIGELSKEFCSEQKYGAHLRGWNRDQVELNDEPEDGDEPVLTVSLVVAKDLEPKWKVVTDRNPEGVDFRSSDRARVGVGLIGAYSEKQLTWAAGTALAKITESDNLNESLVEAARAARSSLDGHRAEALKNFDAAAAKSELVAKGLGVPVGREYKAHLDLNAISIRIGGLTLHDGDIPVRQLGLGSKRMLLCGIQQESLEAQHVTLFDEVEYGLEPHRIARLIRHIRQDKKGQYFLTTHSPTVLRELTVGQLYILHKEVGEVRVVSAAGKDLEGLNIQGQIRSSAEAFLSRKVVICEGATEVGFLRGMDNLWSATERLPFSYLGVVLLDAHGASKIKGLSTGFNALHYDVMVLADGDAQDSFSDQDAFDLNAKDVAVLMWADKLSIEQRAMIDLPWAQVLASAILAKALGFPVHDNVRSKLEVKLDEDIGMWEDFADLRRAIGDAAKSSGWFKNIADGERWAQAVFPAFADATFQQKEFATKLGQFRAWVDNG